MMENNNKILLVDDEPDILEFLSYNLEKEGYEVHIAENGLEGLNKAKDILPDLIVLDIMMPIMDGIQACKEIRKIKSLDNSIIVFLTARKEDYMQIEGLDSGADDYINKPIKPRLFASKINALLRRTKNDLEKSLVKVSGVIIDRDKYEVTVNDRKLNLPRKEFELLGLLMSKPGKVFQREFILSSVWGEDVYVTDRTIDVHIRKLREKIGEKYFITVKGVGYKFSEEL